MVRVYWTWKTSLQDGQTSTWLTRVLTRQGKAGKMLKEKGYFLTLPLLLFSNVLSGIYGLYWMKWIWCGYMCTAPGAWMKDAKAPLQPKQSRDGKKGWEEVLQTSKYRTRTWELLTILIKYSSSFLSTPFKSFTVSLIRWFDDPTGDSTINPLN